MHKLLKHVEQSTIWTDSKLFVLQILAIFEMDMRKLRHDPSELFTRLIQPVVWLIVFGQALAHAHAISTETPYLDYLTPGVLAQNILFVSIFYGIALIWERDMGILHKILVSPAPRVCFVLGRALSAGVRSLFLCVAVYILAYLIHVELKFSFLNTLGVISIVLLGAGVFATFSLIIAAVVKKRERFIGIGQVLTMPLFFASNALYPIETMPHWLQVVSKFNPLSYQVDALRSFMILGETTRFGIGFDFIVTFFVFAALVFIATFVYPRIVN
jgi:ABC-2 type transport system permease protein